VFDIDPYFHGTKGNRVKATATKNKEDNGNQDFFHRKKRRILCLIALMLA
jgi:ribonucleotide reductase beta subunit family protein with ferritin-like domain